MLLTSELRIAHSAVINRKNDVSERLEMLSIIKFILNYRNKGKQHVIRL
jgi:hypothetical protein